MNANCPYQCITHALFYEVVKHVLLNYRWLASIVLNIFSNLFPKACLCYLSEWFSIGSLNFFIGGSVVTLSKSVLCQVECVFRV